MQRSCKITTCSPSHKCNLTQALYKRNFAIMHEVLQVFTIAQMHRCNIGNFKQFPFLHNCNFMKTLSAPSLAHKQMLIKRWLDVNMKRGIDPLCNAMQLALVLTCIAFQLVALICTSKCNLHFIVFYLYFVFIPSDCIELAIQRIWDYGNKFLWCYIADLCVNVALLHIGEDCNTMRCIEMQPGVLGLQNKYNTSIIQVQYRYNTSTGIAIQCDASRCSRVYWGAAGLR